MINRLVLLPRMDRELCLGLCASAPSDNRIDDRPLPGRCFNPADSRS